jgi:hypothetical protein
VNESGILVYSLISEMAETLSRFGIPLSTIEVISFFVKIYFIFKMQYDPAFQQFSGENIDIGLAGSYGMYNPDFGPNYNYDDDHIYGYSPMSVAEQAKERKTMQNGLNYDNLGRRYPGPPPPQDYSYFTQRNPLQGFTSVSNTSNTTWIIILLIIISIVIGMVHTGFLFSIRKNMNYR